MRKDRLFLYRTCLLLFLQFAFFSAQSQWYDPEKVNKAAGEIYGQAYEEAISGKYAEAIKHLEQALSLDPKFVDVYLSRAGIYAEMKNYRASVADFQKGLDMDSVYSRTYLLPYSISLAGAGRFGDALRAVNRFLENTTLNEQSIKAGNYRKRV